MRRWTRFVIRNRRKVLVAWTVLFVLGGTAAANLSGLLTNRFSVPGSEAENGLNIAKQHFAEHGDGDFTLVAVATGPSACGKRCDCAPLAGRWWRAPRVGRSSSLCRAR
jgi:RND superfamily putative drug exporter